MPPEMQETLHFRDTVARTLLVRCRRADMSEPPHLQRIWSLLALISLIYIFFLLMKTS